MTFREARALEQGSFKSASVLLSESAVSTNKNLFLSHSSKDDPLVPGVIEFLSKRGAKVYADDFDETLPNPPSVKTADALKSQIKSLPRLVVVATSNTHLSRWIPWELGLADGFRGMATNAIFPLAEEGTEPAWLKVEYFRLYPLILNIDGAWKVTDPRDSFPWELTTWLTSSVR